MLTSPDEAPNVKVTSRSWITDSVVPFSEEEFLGMRIENPTSSVTTRTDQVPATPTRCRLAYGVRVRLFNGFAILLMTFGLFFSNAAQANEQVILALGDSLTAGYGLAEQESFPVQLQKALSGNGHAVRVINAGVSGDTSAGGLARLDWLLSEQPDIMILELGANDGLRALEPDQTRANLSKIIEKAKAADIPILLTGMLAPPNMGRDYGDAFNAIYPDLAEEYDVVFYPFFLDGVAGEPDLNQGDGMHPTAEGISIIVDRLLPYVEQTLEKKG